LDSNPDWRELYHRCKAKLDHSDKQQIKIQKSLLRLALGFVGRNPKFDKLLGLISTTVRENKKDAHMEMRLQAIIDQITRFSIEDKARLKSQPDLDIKLSQSSPAISSSKLAEFLQKIPSDLEMQAEIAVLAGRVRLTHSDDELDHLVDEAASLLFEHCNSPTTQITSGSESSNYQMVQLLEKITFDKKQLLKVNHIKSILTGEKTTDHPQEAHEMVANLINRSTVQDQNLNETSDFLRKMTLRLENLHKNLDDSELISNDHFSESFSFSQDLDDQFNEIRDGLESNGSITAMKINIESHIDFLNKNVSEYVYKEKERMKHAEETMGALNSQLSILQEETAVLKKSVEEEQVKSLTDALTSIANRRAYEEKLDLEIVRWKRHGGHLSLMVFDLDKFKSINDTYGHVVGDKVLRGLTATFKREIRRTDFLARYGGEEFVIIMPETALEETMVIANKLRAEVEQCVFRYQGQTVPVTISIGVAEFHESDTMITIFERADKALYLAKHSGRNLCRSEAHLTEPA